MSAGVTSERIYDALKLHLLSGDVTPGGRLEPAAFAEMLGSSVTPVRDALHRLVGERIVEMRPTEGFQLPFATEIALRDLLAWNADLLRLALRNWPRGAPQRSSATTANDYASGVRSLFNAVAARAGNPEFERHIEATSDRLTPARVAEQRILDDPERELTDVATVIAEGDAKLIAQRIAAYHRHRIQLVPEIIQAMYRSI